MISIPIIIDNVKKSAEFAMTRCLYFTIDSDTPLTGSSIKVNSRKISLYMIGFSGIICKPIGRKWYFSTYKLIDKLFDTIETNPNLFVDTNDIWLPNMMFDDSPHERGNVYRINENIFIEAIKFRTDTISQERFSDFCSQNNGSAVYSDVETKAFNRWEIRQIEQTKRLRG